MLPPKVDEAELRPSRGTAERARRAFRAVGFANVEDRRPQLGMAQKDPRQFQTGITGDTHDRDLARVSHFKKASSFFCRDSRDFLLGVMISTVSSPAMVPAISGILRHRRRQRGAARRWAAFSDEQILRRTNIEKKLAESPRQGRQRRGFLRERGGRFVARLGFYEAQLLQVGAKEWPG